MLDFSQGRTLPSSLGIVASAGPASVHRHIIETVAECAAKDTSGEVAGGSAGGVSAKDRASGSGTEGSVDLI